MTKPAKRKDWALHARWMVIGAAVAASVLTAALALWLTALSSNRTQEQLHLAELEASVGAQNSALTARLGWQVHQLLAASANAQLRQAAIAALSRAGDGAEGLADWVARFKDQGGLRNLWLARPGDFKILASSGVRKGPDTESLRQMRKSTRAGAEFRLSSPRVDETGELTAYAMVPITLGTRVVSWLVGDLNASLPNGPENGRQTRWRWRLLESEPDEPMLARLAAQLSSGVQPVVSGRFPREQGTVLVALARVPIGMSGWTLALERQPPSHRWIDDFGPLAWRLALGATLLGVLIGVLANRLRERFVDNEAPDRIRAVLRGQADGESRARVMPASGASLSASEQSLNRVLDARDDAIAALSGANEAYALAAGELADSLHGLLHGEHAWSEAVGADIAAESELAPVVAGVNKLINRVNGGAEDVRQSAELVAGAADEMNSEFGESEHALAVQRQVLDKTVRDFGRLRDHLEVLSAHVRDINGAHLEREHWRKSAVAPIAGANLVLTNATKALEAMLGRLKTFGERSQEIGEIVGILLTIAERTRVAALNASMQTASTGSDAPNEAFCDEVGRLSSSARESAAQIQRQAEVIRRETAMANVAINQAIEDLRSWRSKLTGIEKELSDSGLDGEEAGTSPEALDRHGSESLRLSERLLHRIKALDDVMEGGASALRRQRGQNERVVEGVRSILARLARARTQSDQ